MIKPTQGVLASHAKTIGIVIQSLKRGHSEMNETYIWYLRISSINKSQHIDFCGKCLENVDSLQRRVRENGAGKK